MSYRKKHIKNKIYKIKAKKPFWMGWWFWLLILLGVIVFTGAYFFLFYSGFQVKNISVSGSQNLPASQLQQFVFEKARTGLVDMGIIKISSNSIFLVNRKKLEKEALKKFPILEKITVSKKMPQTLVLGIVERKPIAVYCAKNSLENCFLIDQNGIIYEGVNPAQLNMLYPIVRQNMKNEQNFTGENVVQTNIMGAIAKINKMLKENFQINVAEAFVTNPLRLDVKTSENWKIYFNLGQDSDIGLQITKLNLLLAGDITQDGRKKLHYIDLRPKDRAVICDNSVCGK